MGIEGGVSFVLPTLDTPRLRLRTLSSADAPALFAIFKDESGTVVRYAILFVPS
jgi:hypothetical protein